MNNILILQSKNKYNYTKIQLRIDYINKTYELGHFTLSADKTITQKALIEKVEELQQLNFKKLKGN